MGSEYPVVIREAHAQEEVFLVMLAWPFLGRWWLGPEGLGPAKTVDETG